LLTPDRVRTFWYTLNMEKFKKARKSAIIATVINGVFAGLFLLIVSLPCGVGAGECGPVWPMYLIFLVIISTVILPLHLVSRFKSDIDANGIAVTENYKLLLPMLEVLKYWMFVLYIILLSFS